MKCNICGGEKWIDMNKRKGVKCSRCGSLERTRLLWMYIQRELAHTRDILHIAPEKGMHDQLRAFAGDRYVVADLDPSRYRFANNCKRIDLASLEDWPSNQFDLIIHAHVMEHVPCNIAYTMFHLHRMLKDGGKQICVIPFMNGKYDECFQEISDEERIRRFGQDDHVRRFGNMDVQMHLGKIVRVPEKFDATQNFSEKELRTANIPESQWTGFHISTVLCLGKNDYCLR